MKEFEAKAIRFEASKSSGEVGALLIQPKNAKYMLVLAHGAGAGMDHKFMEALAQQLAVNGVATFRFNFPYVEQGRKFPGPPAISQKTIYNAIDYCTSISPEIPLFVGGKSYGGRMSSQMMAATPHTSVRGLIFFGFPLHAPGKPSINRADHLYEVKAPMLFLQGTRDTLATMDLIKEVTDTIGERATLKIIDGADHSFHVLKNSETNDKKVLNDICLEVSDWVRKN